jgi:hypothetical protein
MKMIHSGSYLTMPFWLIGYIASNGRKTANDRLKRKLKIVFVVYYTGLRTEIRTHDPILLALCHIRSWNFIFSSTESISPSFLRPVWWLIEDSMKCNAWNDLSAAVSSLGNDEFINAYSDRFGIYKFYQHAAPRECVIEKLCVILHPFVFSTWI